MTPGLPGFIADGSERQTWDDVTSAALAALGTEFGVVAEHGSVGASGGVRRTTWLDTFDWRLHKAGLTLEYVPGRAGSELRLSGAGKNAETSQDAVQLVTGWQASRPHLLAALAGGPVGARIAGLIAPRALLPVVTVTTSTAVYRLLNEDSKTVARLFIDRGSLVGQLPSAGAIARPARAPAGETTARAANGESVGAASAPDPELAQLPPRLTVAEVRGYSAQARRANRLLASVPGFKPAETITYADALRAIGRRPGDYSNKVDAAVTASMPAAGAGAAILMRLLDTIEANLDGTLKDIDIEFLHDLRVSVRRTRSALKLFGDLLGLPPKQLAFFAAEFKWVGDLTTPTRDLDVQLLEFEDTARGLAAAKPDDLEPFRIYLETRRRKEFRALTRGLRSARFTTLTREWRAKLVKIKQENSGPIAVTSNEPSIFDVGGRIDPSQRGKKREFARSGRPAKAAGGTAGLLAAERTRVAFAKVARRGAAITPDTPAEALHDLRKRCKELRYALEFFAPLHDPSGVSMVVGDLKRLQDCLGEFQDTEVQIEEVRTLATAMLAAGEAPAVTLLAMGEITAGLAARQRAARSDFERRFAAFADLDGQRRMAALLRGTRVR